MEGVSHVLRRHKVIDDLNTAVEVLDLQQSQQSSKNKPNTSIIECAYADLIFFFLFFFFCLNLCSETRRSFETTLPYIVSSGSIGYGVPGILVVFAKFPKTNRFLIVPHSFEWEHI